MRDDKGIQMDRSGYGNGNRERHSRNRLIVGSLSHTTHQRTGITSSYIWLRTRLWLTSSSVSDGHITSIAVKRHTDGEV